MRGHRRHKNRVIATGHAVDRWVERAERSPGNLGRIMSAALNDQLGAGVPVVNGQPIIKLSAERLGLQEDLVVPLEMPEAGGIWKAITVKPKGGI